MTTAKRALGLRYDCSLRIISGRVGYLTYYKAQAAAQCKLTGKVGETLKAGRLGDYTVGDKGEIILGPAKIVTPENLAEFKF